MANKHINEYNPSDISKPGLTILDFLEEKGWTQTELSQRMGRPINKVNEIITGKISITPETAIQLERVLGVPSSFWNNRQKQYDEFIANEKEKEKLSKHINWLTKFPINEMIKNKWIRKQKDTILQLKELLSFFSVSSPEEWDTIWMSPNVAYKQSTAFSKKPESNSVWLRRGEIVSQKILCDPFDSNKFKFTLRSIRELTNKTPDNFSDQMVDLCAEAGVALVFIPRLKGLPVYGITRWINPKKAMIQLSLYRKYEDYFWFTFFHEAAHLIVHGKKDVFIETKTSSENKKEIEADIFASNFLIPKKQWEKFITSSTKFTEKSILDLADEINVCSGIIVGRLHREKLIKYSQMNHLRRKIDFIN